MRALDLLERSGVLPSPNSTRTANVAVGTGAGVAVPATVGHTVFHEDISKDFPKEEGVNEMKSWQQQKMVGREYTARRELHWKQSGCYKDYVFHKGPLQLSETYLSVRS